VDGFSLPVVWSNGSTTYKTIFLNKQEITFELDAENAQPNIEVSYFNLRP
jgi:hypothetical protein